MPNSFHGFLIILSGALVAINLVMIMLNEPTLLTWLNQTFMVTILVAVASHLAVGFATRKTVKKAEETESSSSKDQVSAT